MGLNIVLVEPEIPQNTGNIVRTCAATGASLHLVRPLGFSTDDKYLKRAGLDYWYDVHITYYDHLAHFMQTHPDKNLYFASTKAAKNYSQLTYPEDCFILFGKESKGLPEALLDAHYQSCIRIPMLNSIRSLNLSNSVAVILYEYYRQSGFEKLQQVGQLTVDKRPGQ